MVLYASPAAWVIILQACATYASVYSAWCFALPVLRSQGLQFSRDTLNSIETDKTDIKELIAAAADKLDVQLQQKQPGHIRRNLHGILWLAISLLLFTVAVALQLATDPAFGRHPP